MFYMAAKKNKPFLKVKNLGGRPTKYKAEYPKLMVAWFQEGLDEIAGVDVYENKLQDRKHFTKPVFPRTLGGWALTVGASSSVLHEWSSEHPKFLAAMNIAKDIQGQIAIMMTTTGAWNASAGIFMLKNCSGWRDKIDVTLEAQTSISFDSEDEDA